MLSSLFFFEEFHCSTLSDYSVYSCIHVVIHSQQPSLEQLKYQMYLEDTYSPLLLTSGGAAICRTYGDKSNVVNSIGTSNSV